MFPNLDPRVWLIRLIAAMLFLFIGIAIGTYLATQHYKAKQADVAIKEVEAAPKQQKATDDAVTHFVDNQNADRAASAAIQKEIQNEVPDNIVLPAPYRVLHDAAATSTIPGPTDVADARPVAAIDLAETVAENYAACESNRQQLIALQEWVSNQQGITLH